MFDWSQMRDLIWEARWDGLVMLAQALWINVLTHWWFGPLLVVVMLTASRKAWMRLIRYIGVAYVRGSSDT